MGAMGGAIARRLLRLNFRVHVRDVRPEPMRDLEALGARTRSSPSELAQHCDIVIVLVVDAEQIEEVLFGPSGVIHSLGKDALVVVSSTISPEDAASFAARLSANGLLSLDAPISGGPARAETGTLSMMLAGEPPALHAARELLPILASKVFNVGERAGDGARFKLLNNALAAVNLAAGAEVLALGEKLGLDARQILEVVGNSSGQSWVVMDRMQRALKDDFLPRAATKILAKDVSLFVDMARHAHFPGLISTHAMQVFQAAVANGLGEEDDGALLKLYRGLLGKR